MVDLKQTVCLTNVNMEKMSRKDYLDWVNRTVNGNYKKVEELCSGVAYCQMMEQLYPNVIGLKRIKSTPKMEYEYLHNLRLFQGAFTRLKLDKAVPIESLLKGKFQDNFAFLQWFKKFYDTTCNSNVKENCPINSQPKAKLGNKSASNSSLNAKEPKAYKERSISPSSVLVIEESKAEMAQQIEMIEVERDVFLNKLKAIEDVLNKSIKDGNESDFCQEALKILYAVNNNNTSDTEPKPDFPEL